MKKFWEKFKFTFIYLLLAIVVIAVCVVSALYAFHLQNRAETADNIQKETLSAHNYITTISVPFEMKDDLAFNVEPEIRYYVKNTKAFYGHDEDISLHIYSITYNTELFDNSWLPNINNMADVSMLTIKRNKLFTNLESEKKQITVSGIKAIEVVSIYNNKSNNIVQRIVHVPTNTCTWSFKATYKNNLKNTQIVSKILESIVIRSN